MLEYAGMNPYLGVISVLLPHVYQSLQSYDSNSSGSKDYVTWDELIVV